MLPQGKYLADGLQSGCTANSTGVQYKRQEQILEVGETYGGKERDEKKRKQEQMDERECSGYIGGGGSGGSDQSFFSGTYTGKRGA